MVIKERRIAEINYVDSIASFDEDYLDIVTKWGSIILVGKGMTIISLDKDSGVITVEGEFTDLSFENRKRKKKGGRLFD